MKRLAIPAAIGFHICATIIISIAGKFVPLSQLFPDTVRYQTQITASTDVLKNLGLGAWFFSLLPFHVKLYALSYAVFSHWFGFSILLIEPLNAFYYIGILGLVYYLGLQLFSKQTALLATVAVAVWPSFLVHTTQPLKDPLFLLFALLFLTINCLWLIRDYSWRQAVAMATLGVGTECVLWTVKSDMWELMIAVGVLTCGTLLVKTLKDRKFTWGNIAGAVLLLVISVMIPRVAVKLYQPALGWAKARGVAALHKEDPTPVNESVDSIVSRGARQDRSYRLARVSILRDRFIDSYSDAGSNIDTNVRFYSTGDIMLYLPRAAIIGLFAPFPKMWFAAGSQNGRTGRIIGGFETAVLYLIESMALIGLWHKRRRAWAWWLLLVSLTSMTALGLVVTNVGALYRFRYVFVMLLVILGSDGVRRTLRYIADARRGIAVKQV